MTNLARSRDRQDDGAMSQEPGERDLSRRRSVRLRDAADGAFRSSQPAGGERVPRNEADAVLGAIGELVLARAVAHVVAVLHGRHGKEALGRLNLGHRDFAEARVPDDAVVEQLANGAELLVARHPSIDAMELPEIDPLDAELLQAALGLTNQVRRPSVGLPAVRAGTRETRLRRDQHARIRMQRFAQELFGHVGAVAVGGVDEVDAELGQPAQRRERRVPVPGRSPDPWPRDPHRAVAEAIDGRLSDLELTRGAGVDGAHGARSFFGWRRFA